MFLGWVLKVVNFINTYATYETVAKSARQNPARRVRVVSEGPSKRKTVFYYFFRQRRVGDHENSAWKLDAREWTNIEYEAPSASKSASIVGHRKKGYFQYCQAVDILPNSFIYLHIPSHTAKYYILGKWEPTHSTDRIITQVLEHIPKSTFNQNESSLSPEVLQHPKGFSFNQHMQFCRFLGESQKCIILLIYICSVGNGCEKRKLESSPTSPSRQRRTKQA